MPQHYLRFVLSVLRWFVSKPTEAERIAIEEYELERQQRKGQ
jgi:hypothetical protein